MRDDLYEREARPHHSGGWYIYATALGPKDRNTGYQPQFFCTHNDGDYHMTAEDALNCPQYQDLIAYLR